MIPTDSHIALCASCNADLRSQPLPAWNPQAARFQQLADETLVRGAAQYGDDVILTAEWFRLARFIITLLRAAARTGHQRFAQVFVRLGLDPRLLQSPTTGLPLELLPIGDRTSLLALANRVLDAGPDALAEAMRSEGLTRGAVPFDGAEGASYLDSLLSTLPVRAALHERKPSTKSRHPRSKVVVERMAARLRRKVRL
ncbi:hypothetical protein AT302_10615 [Pandoraea norimbergensis]|uniref:Uncharacterized protein n=1 Tax=Pandoraea norimbergensis TaxID=93219 RepID=A0ABM5WIV1_9BURK|nr:hypothetical protein AT302_10615 [Pandoraea norimbergensis]